MRGRVPDIPVSGYAGLSEYLIWMSIGYGMHLRNSQLIGICQILELRDAGSILRGIWLVMLR